MTRYYLALIAVLATINARLGAVELIRNGSFEADGLVDGAFLTGWEEGTGGAAVWEYPIGDCGDEWCGGVAAFDVPGAPNSGVSGPVGRETFYAYAFATGTDVGGVVEFDGFSAQHVDLTGHESKPFEFSAWLASRLGSDNDYAVVKLEFFSEPDAAGTSLGSFSFDGNDQQSALIVGSANIEGQADPNVLATQDNWTFYRTRGTIPDSASSASVSIAGRAVAGTGFVNHGFVDLVSLHVVPEPSSAVLTALLGAVGAVWCTRRKAIPRRI